ncbi:hypothetical protein L6452_22551 [Arctium lappa]|uniref:Uncharacterized protein n=1 Tax=Arctium lappa TaxID=4217 RepID=A0ACB9B062_ARCLA|nr:hypothetical protein L6452_22551 [Arctium lappa]
MNPRQIKPVRVMISQKTLRECKVNHKPHVLKVFSNLAHSFVNHPRTNEGSEQLGGRICNVMENKFLK